MVTSAKILHLDRFCDKILRRGENYLGVLNAARIQVHRAFNVFGERRHFGFQLVGLPLDFWQVIRHCRSKEKNTPIDNVAHFRFVVIGEVEWDHVRSMVHRSVVDEAPFDFTNKLGIRDERTDEELDRVERV